MTINPPRPQIKKIRGCKPCKIYEKTKILQGLRGFLQVLRGLNVNVCRRLAGFAGTLQGLPLPNTDDFWRSCRVEGFEPP